MDICKDMCRMKKRKVENPDEGKTCVKGLKEKTNDNKRGDGIVDKTPL